MRAIGPDLQKELPVSSTAASSSSDRLKGLAHLFQGGFDYFDSSDDEDAGDHASSI